MLKVDRRVLAGVCVGVTAGLAVGGASIATGDGDDGAELRARAKIMNVAGQQIGEAVFTQDSTRKQPEPLVDVDVTVRNLPPPLSVGGGRPLDPNLRGFHVHDNGSCTAEGTGTFDAGAAGGHFDVGAPLPPGNKNTGNLPFGARVEDNHPYHLGDLPNLRREDDGEFKLRTKTSRFVIQGNHATSIFEDNGAAVIVHKGQDLGGPGQPANTPAPFAGGGRDGCGVVKMERASDDD